MIKLTFKNGLFLGRSSFNSRNVFQNSGFRFSTESKMWYTKSSKIAWSLREHADEYALRELSRQFIIYSPWAHAIPYPKELTPYPFQIQAACYALARNRSYLGMDPGCISGDAIIKVNRGGCSRKMKLKDLFAKFHGQVTCGRSWDLKIPTRTASVNAKGELRLNTIIDVIDNGMRFILEIKARTSSGKSYTLKCTPDHEILTPHGWVAASKLNVNSIIKTNGKKFCEVCKTHTRHVEYQYAKYKGQCLPCVKSSRPPTTSIDKDGYRIVYGGMYHHPRCTKGFVYEHVLAFEAKTNHLTLDQWIAKIRRNEIEGCFTVPKSKVIHHINEVKADNSFSNLEMLDVIDHARHHGDVNQIPHMVVEDARITSIKPVGLARVFDIVMADPHRNFVADGVVVHNCGKTPTAIMIANALLKANVIERVLYVCPPFLMTNVSAELERWSTFDLNLARYSNDKTKPIPYAQNVVLFPDSLFSIEKRTGKVDVRIQNFLNNWLMLSRGLIIIDEAHRFKNERTQRSLALYKGVLPHFARAVFMSGTPMPNSPIELYPVLSNAAPETIDFKTRFEYGLKYCGAHKTQFGWKFDGATNQGELTKNVRAKFLLRIKKRDVLTELPPKTEAVVFLDANYPAKLAELEAEVLRKYSPRDLMHSQLGDEHVATYRRELGFIKAPKAAEFIRGVLEDSGESLLVFAHHKEVVEYLKEELRHYDPLVIAGYVPTEERARRAELFQKSNKHRVLILNIQAGGIGFNLTKASRVIFVEYSWVPAENEQAIDRAHRIGQTENVFAQYLVYRHSLDAKMMLSVLHKQKVTGKL